VPAGSAEGGEGAREGAGEREETPEMGVGARGGRALQPSSREQQRSGSLCHAGEAGVVRVGERSAAGRGWFWSHRLAFCARVCEHDSRGARSREFGPRDD
jgi:hypothetical protein